MSLKAKYPWYRYDGYLIKNVHCAIEVRSLGTGRIGYPLRDEFRVRIRLGGRTITLKDTFETSGGARCGLLRLLEKHLR